ncbi:hypothetical protein CEY12_05960 [Chryseobacterium sp. T16E-39]|uniref:hypothetical protein n=1 Tax=Chryseobacterium sp. T16E-39 TaxID=2015076 RepID=UPI000B5B41B7|nr:hypothetical protein [Chryseobacterium sp. T16E-39]ASK29676.1 hypothetical protein CEY12_05960 [Chryseobacterium sp. T16E-39]
MTFDEFSKIAQPISTIIAALAASIIAIVFAKRLERYKNSVLIKKKSELIAELLSIWISQPNDFKRINELTFEIFLWLPKKHALELSKTLSMQEGSKGMREIISDIRVYLLGKDEKIPYNKIIVFTGKSKRIVNP